MAFLILVLVIVLPLALLKYQGIRAMRTVTIQVSGLTVEQIVEIGTKVSHSFVRRLLGRPQAQPTPDGGAIWYIRSGAGVMTVLVEPRQEGGFHVSAAATSMRIAQHNGLIDPNTDWGRAKIITNWLFRLMGIPHNARKLMRQRRRVLRAISRAGQPIPAAPQPVLGPTDQVGQIPTPSTSLD